MFKEVEKGVFSPNLEIKGVRVSRVNGSIRIVIDRGLFKQLGEPKFVKMLRGDGEHEGMVAMMPIRAKVANAYTMNKANRSISISPKRFGVEYRGKAKVVPHEVTEDGLVIDLRGLV
jgi:hypothetical protein